MGQHRDQLRCAVAPLRWESAVTNLVASLRRRGGTTDDQCPRRGVVAVKYENPPYDLQEAGPPTNIGGPEVPPAPHTLGELNPMPMPAEFSQLDITSTAARIREQKKTRANGFWRLMDDPTQKGYF